MTRKELKEWAFDRGTECHRLGINILAFDTVFQALYCSLPPEQQHISIMKAWVAGWTIANLNEPV